MVMRIVLAAALGAAALAAPAPAAEPQAAVKMWRLDCGEFDIKDYDGKGRIPRFPVSCYIIRHGDDLVLFDAGVTDRLVGRTVERPDQSMTMGSSLAYQLAQLGIDAARVQTLVVSHYHGDHLGQAGSVANARLVIGAGDMAYIKTLKEVGSIAPWVKGDRPVEEVTADKDLFGDGTVRVLATPGHTPGHLALLVKTDGGNFILTGDAVHQRDQLDSRTPPGNHEDKVRGKAEIERLLALAKAENAKIVIGHDIRDVPLVPAIPVTVK